MIQKRIAHHLRTQNWTSVLIEFVLVVVGVLIALEVNNWNQQRQALAFEKQYINRLIQDLEADINSFSVIQNRSEERLASGLRLREIISGADASNDDLTSLVAMVRSAGFTARPTITNDTFQALVSGGKLHLIESSIIQSKVMSYYSSLTARKQYDYIIEHNQLGYLHVTESILTMEQRDRFFAKKDETVSIEEGQLILSNIMINQDFHRSLPNVIINQRNFNGDARRGIARAKLLIQELNNYAESK